MGRWMSPDWSAKEEPVPYAKLDDPQSLNLYQYMGNDPLGGVDPDGHDGPGGGNAVVLGGPIIVTPEGLSDVNRFLSNPIVQLGMAFLPGGIEEDIAVDSVSVATEEIAPVEEIAPTAEEGAAPASTQTQTAASSSGGETKETGSYTNTHASGKTYSGKGSRERSQTSGERVEKQTGDKHTATDWTPSTNDREAFKDESRRIDAKGGPSSTSNHNQIESPGKKYRAQDGSN